MKKVNLMMFAIMMVTLGAFAQKSELGESREQGMRTGDGGERSTGELNQRRACLEDVGEGEKLLPTRQEEVVCGWDDLQTCAELPCEADVAG